MTQEEVEPEAKEVQQEVQLKGEFCKCPVCGQVIKTRGRYGHFRTQHPELNYHEHKGGFLPAEAPRVEKPTEEPREGPLYRGEIGPEEQVELVRTILENYPDIPVKVIDEVCSWAQFGPIHPTQLAYLLSNMRGVSSTTANIVAQKYSLALNKLASEGRVTVPLGVTYPQQQQVPPFYQQPYQQPQQYPQQYHPYTWTPSPWQPYGQQTPWPQPQPSQPQLTDRDMRAIIREELREKEPRKEPEQYVDLEEPVKDEEGRVVVGPDDKPIMKKTRVPLSQAHLFTPREDSEMKFLEKLKLYREVLGEKGLTEEKIREIVRSEKPPEKPPEPQLTLEDVKKVTNEAVERYDSMRDEREEEQKRHKELLETQKKGFESLERSMERAVGTKTVEGYTQDSYRLLGQGVQSLAERRPIEVIIREGAPLLLGAPPPKEVEEEAQSTSLLARLKKRGWVAER